MYILSPEEFEIIDILCSLSKLQDDGFYLMQTQDGTNDYFVDCDKTLTLEEGLLILSDAIDFEEYVEYGWITEQQFGTLLDLLDKCNIAY